MSLFKPNYNKPGRGVEKDEPQGSAPIRYFKLYFRNFSKMIRYGTVYFLLLLPLICFAVYFVTVRVNPDIVARYVEVLTSASQQASEYVEEGKQVMMNSWVALFLTIAVYVPRGISIPLVVICAICIGPINCGLVYCMRNHAREEHAWFSDMFVRAWRNKWQGLAFGLIDQGIILALLMYLFTPGTLGLPNAVFLYLRVFCIAVFIIWQVMRWYVYQMIVTFTLKFRGLMKNAWMFVILGFGRNIAVALGSLAILLICVLFPLFYPSSMPFMLLTMMFLMWSMLIFLAVFGTYPVMHKYLVAPALEEQKKAEAKRRKEAGLPEEEDPESGSDEKKEESDSDSILDDD